ncbi:MAG: HNH endonuclease [Bacteroidota bacterium]
MILVYNDNGNNEKSGSMEIHEPKLIALGRRLNTTVTGEEFDSATIDLVWDKAFSEWGFYFFRKDIYSFSMAKQDFGKKTKFGWEIDHIIPVSRGGTDDLSNLQPLHWKNNRKKGEHITIMNGNGNGNGLKRQ